MAGEPKPRAVIYTTDPSDAAAAGRCVTFLQDQGFQLAGVTQDWRALERMLDGDAAEYAIVDRRDDIPVDPRVLIAAEKAGPRRPRAPRPSRLNRRVAGA